MTLANYSEHDKVSAIRYEQPHLSSILEESTVFNAKGLWTPTVDAENIAYQSMFKPFSLNQYLYPRPPIDLGLIEGLCYFDVGPNVLRMPLKFPGSTYRIPKECLSLLPLIERVAEYEAFINPEHASCFCHMTRDHSLVQAGTYHRYPGFHGDGIQGTKLTPKVNVEHSYIITSAPPTEFCLQPFFLKHLDEAKHNFFLEFDRQAKDVNIFDSLPYHLYLIDPYMVHRSPKIPVLSRDVRRLFIRITYAFTELQHPKNTLNPLFGGQGYHKRVDIRANLCRNEFEVPYHLYGLNRKEPVEEEVDWLDSPT